jgi:hypothetical protein
LVAVTGQGQQPPIPRSIKAGRTGDLLLNITGGTASQKIIANVTVFLSVNLGATSATDTATWSSSQGSVEGTKTGNSYTFKGVEVILPGTGAPFQVKITNMRIDASTVTGPNLVPVLANILIATVAGDPPLIPTPAQVQVAVVQAG